MGMFLLCKHEDLSSDLQLMLLTQAMICNVSIWAAVNGDKKIIGARWPAR